METTMTLSTQPNERSVSKIGKAFSWSDLMAVAAVLFVLLFIALMVDLNSP
jgi:hypothetical protein